MHIEMLDDGKWKCGNKLAMCSNSNFLAINTQKQGCNKYELDECLL